MMAARALEQIEELRDAGAGWKAPSDVALLAPAELDTWINRSGRSARSMAHRHIDGPGSPRTARLASRLTARRRYVQIRWQYVHVESRREWDGVEKCHCRLSGMRRRRAGGKDVRRANSLRRW